MTATASQLIAARNKMLLAAKAEIDAGMSAADVLALLAHTTGACIAWQDQRSMTPEAAMKLVSDNIQAGNLEAMAEVMSAGGRGS